MKTSQETVLKTLRVLFKKTVSKLEVEKFLKYKKLFSFFKIFLKHRNTFMEDFHVYFCQK